MNKAKNRYFKIITAGIGILSLFSFVVLAQTQPQNTNSSQKCGGQQEPLCPLETPGTIYGCKAPFASNGKLCVPCATDSVYDDGRCVIQDKPKKEELIKFTVTPQEIPYGGMVTLTWNIQAKLLIEKGCVAIGPGHWDGPLTVESGSKKVSPDQTREYRITCGDLTESRVVRVKKEGFVKIPEENLSRVDLYIDKIPDNGVFKGEPVKLRWNYESEGIATTAEKCTLRSSADIIALQKGLLTGRNPFVSNEGSMEVTPQFNGEVYTFECLRKSIDLKITYNRPDVIDFNAHRINADGSLGDELPYRSEVKPGTKIQLAWHVRGADECRGEIILASPISSRSYVPVSDEALKSKEYSDDERAWHNHPQKFPVGSANLTPLDSRIYQLVCNVDNKKLGVQQLFEIKTSLDLPALSFSVLPAPSPEGYRFSTPKAGYKTGIVPYEIKWSGENISACEAESNDGSWKGKRGYNGQELIFSSATSTYTMECVSKGGKKVRQGPKTPVKKETLSFVETKAGTLVNLKWSGIGVDQCSASSEPRTMWSGVKGYDGEESVAVDQKTIFNLACGSQKESLTVAIAKEQTVVPPEIIDTPQSKPQKLSISSITYSDTIPIPGKQQLFSGMDIHNFTDKPIEVGSVLLKFTQPVVNSVQLQYSNKKGEYDKEATAVSGQGRENYFYFKFPKSLVIEPDPKIPYKRGDAGLMKWWLVGAGKSVDKKIDFDTIVDEVMSLKGETIELEAYTEPTFQFSVNNLAMSIGEDPISYSILTVAPEQPLLLTWFSEGMDEQKGCIASIGLGGTDRDKREWSGKKDVLTGEAWVHPTVTTLYKLNCSRGEQTITRDVFAQINERSKSIPYIDFTYRKGKNSKGQAGVYTSWLVKNASSCEASNGDHEKQTSWNGPRVISDKIQTEFVQRPAGENRNFLFLTCQPKNKELSGYFSSSHTVRWEDGKDEDDAQVSLALDSSVPNELPVGAVSGRQLLGSFSMELPKGTDQVDRIVVVRDEKFGEQSLGQFFKNIELQYDDVVSGNRGIERWSTDGDKALTFKSLFSLLKGVRGSVNVSVYGELVGADALKKLKISEKGERLRLVIADVDARSKDKKLILPQPFELQTFVVKIPAPVPVLPPVVSKGILFASHDVNAEIEIQDKATRLTLANLRLEALGEDIEIRSIAINQSFGNELSSFLAGLRLISKNEEFVFVLGDVGGDTIYFTPAFGKKLILPKNGKTIELLLVADAAASISEILKEKIRDNPVVLSLKTNGVSGVGLASNQSIGNSTPFNLVTLTVPPKLVDNTACDATVEEFKATGKIRCGRIQWDITPKSAQVFNGDPRAYLMKYDELYGFYKDFMGGYEPRQGKVTLRENPALGHQAEGDWVNGVIPMDTSFTLNHIVVLGNFPTKTFSPSFMHEMGHIFGLGHETRPAYIWKDMVEGHANMVGILPYMMAYDGQFKLISDFWCINKLKKNYPCEDYFTNFEDYPEWLGANKDLEKYQERGETFSTLFIDPPKDQNVYERGGKFQTMLTTLYSEFKKQGKGPQFYQGYKNALQFYIKNPSVFPSSWLKGDSDFEMASDTILKANTYLLLLSAYAKSDILSEFEKRWRTPILPKVKEAYAAILRENYSDASILAAVKAVLPKSPFPRSIQMLPSNGLIGEYFSNTDLTGVPRAKRVDSQIDFVWNGTSPITNISDTNFSVRWKGFIVAPETATYNLYTIADDGVRLWIGDRQLIDDWNVHKPTLKKGVIELGKGKSYPITLEYYQMNWNSGVRFAWAKQGDYEDIIPSMYLFPTQPSKDQIGEILSAVPVKSTITLSPQRGKVGQIVSMKGSGYPSSVGLLVRFDGTLVNVTSIWVTGKDGTFEDLKITIPATIKKKYRDSVFSSFTREIDEPVGHGNHTIEITDGAGTSVTQTFVVE